MSILRALFTLILVIFTVSCTYKGGVENPVTRKFTWFSYVNGDDIRKVCAELGADRYRFVYNGIYQRQTRTYDVFFHTGKIKITVNGEANLRNTSLNDLFSPWRATTSEIDVERKVLKEIKNSLISSAALQPAPTGLRLYSDKFHWTVAACVEGEFYFNGYLWPSKRWEAMTFDDLLLSLDNTGVALEEPKRLSPLDIWGSMSDVNPFLLEVGKNGLVGFEGG
jgi:hypothetical protein